MNILERLGPVWDASGARGFSGEGYWYHRFVPGLSFKGSTLVTKTSTTFSNLGNMELKKDYTPLRLFPDCIYIDALRGVTLNSVGLSGPGFEKLLATNRLIGIRNPLLISWMPIAASLDGQIEEAEEFVRLLKPILEFFLSCQVAVQLNISCPNVHADFSEILQRALILLDILQALGIPVIVKLNLVMSPVTASQIALHPACMGICITNTAPFGTVLPEEEWLRLFPKGSPLLRRNVAYGKGGLSGPLLLPYVIRWIRAFRIIDGHTHVNAGGGIWRASDVDLLKAAGASSIFIGTVAMLRPWRVQSIIKRGHLRFTS